MIINHKFSLNNHHQKVGFISCRKQIRIKTSATILSNCKIHAFIDDL